MIGVKSIGKMLLQFKFGLVDPDSETISLCVQIHYAGWPETRVATFYNNKKQERYTNFLIYKHKQKNCSQDTFLIIRKIYEDIMDVEVVYQFDL